MISKRTKLRTMSSARKNVIDAPEDGWLSVPQAARALGIAPATVLQRVLRGELQSQMVAGRTFISADSVTRAIAAPKE